MRPAAWKANQPVEAEPEPESGEDDEGVAGTQAQDGDIPSDIEGPASDAESDAEAAATKSKKKKKAKSKSKDDETAAEPKKGRKVNPLAHANYRALKIKSKGSKGKGSGGRFGRRR